jgi:hypothetical protein
MNTISEVGEVVPRCQCRFCRLGRVERYRMVKVRSWRRLWRARWELKRIGGRSSRGLFE